MRKKKKSVDIFNHLLYNATAMEYTCMHEESDLMTIDGIVGTHTHIARERERDFEAVSSIR